MFDRFTKEAREVVKRAEAEAREAGSRTIEAEHLLLAAGGAVGLDREDLLRAFAQELRHSLDAAGVGLGAPEPRPIGVAPRFATSAKAALERALAIAADRGDRRIGARHVALGAALAERGTVPRALRLAGIDVPD